VEVRDRQQLLERAGSSCRRSDSAVSARVVGEVYGAATITLGVVAAELTGATGEQAVDDAVLLRRWENDRHGERYTAANRASGALQRPAHSEAPPVSRGRSRIRRRATGRRGR
jgi:hypothetical protein